MLKQLLLENSNYILLKLHIDNVLGDFYCWHFKLLWDAKHAS